MNMRTIHICPTQKHMHQMRPTDWGQNQIFFSGTCLIDTFVVINNFLGKQAASVICSIDLRGESV